MAAVLAAIITLVGTLAVGGIGVWQWQRTQSTSQQKDYRAKRVEALTALWDALVGIEEEQRNSFRMNIDPASVNKKHLRSVNMMLIKLAPFLLDDERDWSVTILQHIIEIDTSVRIQREHDLPSVEWWASTSIQPNVMAVTAVAAQGLRTAHKALAERYAAVIRGDHD